MQSRPSLAKASASVSLSSCHADFSVQKVSASSASEAKGGNVVKTVVVARAVDGTWKKKFCALHAAKRA